MVAIAQHLSRSLPGSGSQNIVAERVLRDLASVSVEQRTCLRSLSQCQYDNERFRIGKIKFAPQFSSLYFVRLVQVRQMVLEKCYKMDIDERKVKICTSFLEIENGIDCIICGTIYKNMKLKPSVIDEYTAENAVAKETFIERTALCGRFVSADDNIELEDEHARLKLVGDLNVDQLVTGVVIGFRGRLLSSGEFSVNSFVLPDLSSTPPPSLASDKYVLLVSGLNCGDNSILPHLMADHITGLLADSPSNYALRLISRLVICGNAIRTVNELPGDQDLSVRPKRIGTITATQTLPALRTLDVLLEQLCSSIDVDLMPGFMDPTNVALPQQPFNPLFLPRSSRLSSLKLIPNPANLFIDNIFLYGTSGQNVHDIMEYTSSMSELDIIEATYRWRISCPTCPDTLHSLPFNDKDPFIITELPRVYFAGNQSKFDTRLITTSEGCPVRLIAIPRFVETGQAVLLNLRSLDCEIIQYSSND